MIERNTLWKRVRFPGPTYEVQTSDAYKVYYTVKGNSFIHNIAVDIFKRDFVQLTPDEVLEESPIW